jgi:hypothetical protein
MKKFKSIFLFSIVLFFGCRKLEIAPLNEPPIAQESVVDEVSGFDKGFTLDTKNYDGQLQLDMVKMYGDSGELTDSIQFSYEGTQVSNVKTYYFISMYSGPQFNGQFTYTWNNQNQLVKGVYANPSNPSDDPLNDTTTYLYDNGQLLKRHFRYYNDREVQFYYTSGKLTSAILRFKNVGKMNDYSLEEFYSSADGKFLEVRWYLYNNNAKTLSMVKQFEFDDKVNPYREVFRGFIDGNYTNLSKNNVKHVKTIEYSGSGQQGYDIYYSYQYNAKGYPVKKIATGDLLYGNSIDHASVTEYFYNK